ncbi:acyltransferase family protein [Nocardiopsis rhodophaea]
MSLPSTNNAFSHPDYTKVAHPHIGRSSIPGHRKRPEIDGLRAVAILLVAVYHVWLGGVSGGVDVFLLLTGFLITGSLIRSVDRQDGIALIAFWTRLLKRLAPSAAIVLGAVLLGAFIYFPRSRWLETISDVISSALYYANWHLAFGAVDYLADNNTASPVQHFWSLAVQGQFYLLWPFVVLGAAILASRTAWSFRTWVLLSCMAIFAASLTYSIFVTHHSSVWAYFDSGARLWELALGGIAAAVLPRISLPCKLRVMMGWTGLISLVLCGILVPKDSAFPGYIALWPTLGALLILLAGTTRSRIGADRILSWRPLTALGKRAYSFYLWHWPVLIFYLEVTDRVRPSLIGGSYVIASSLLLAFATTRLIEDGVTRFTRSRTTPAWSLSIIAASLVPVLAIGGLWGGLLENQLRTRTEQSSNPTLYPGAAIYADSDLKTSLPTLPVHPDPSIAEKRTKSLTDDCNTRIPEDDVIACEYGPADAEYTIVLVGSSHARHWFHALERITEDNGWRLIMITKSACQFTPAIQYRHEKEYTACTTWNTRAFQEISEIHPDLVFTLATQTDQEGNGHEVVVDGYQEIWRDFDDMGIDVLAVRDTPRLGFNVSECVSQHRREDCTSKSSRSLSDSPPFDEISQDHNNVTFVDLTDHLCPDGICREVIGNRLVYFDDNHFTYAFSESLAPVLDPYIRKALNDALPKA